MYFLELTVSSRSSSGEKNPVGFTLWCKRK